MPNTKAALQAIVPATGQPGRAENAHYDQGHVAAAAELLALCQTVTSDGSLRDTVERIISRCWRCSRS